MLDVYIREYEHAQTRINDLKTLLALHASATIMRLRASGVEQSTIASVLDVDRTFVYGMEKNHRPASIDVYRKLATLTENNADDSDQ